MTTQLPPRERPDTAGGREREAPDVLFEEARRRRRRRWMAASAIVAAAIIAGALILGAGGGGGGGATGTAHGQPSGSVPGASSAQPSSRLFAGAPSTQPNAGVENWNCPLAPHNRYLPRWSGCVTALVTDLAGDGRKDLLLIFSRVGHKPISDPQAPPGLRTVYQAKRAMLRIVTPTGAIVTTAINGVRTADLFSLAHVNNEPGKEIFLQVQQTSSGAVYTAYSFDGSRLISAGAGFGAGGDSADGNGFACLPGNPPRVIERNYQLIHGIKLVHQMIFGLWNEEITSLVWRGPRLVVVSRQSFKRRLVPKENVGEGCLKGVS